MSVAKNTNSGDTTDELSDGTMGVSQYRIFMHRLEKPAPIAICKSLLEKLHSHQEVHAFDSEITLCINEIEQSFVEAGTPISWAQLYCMAHVLNQEIIVLAPTIPDARGRVDADSSITSEGTAERTSDTSTHTDPEEPAALLNPDPDMESYLKDLDTCFGSMWKGDVTDAA
jgi:hypothetical protein